MSRDDRLRLQVDPEGRIRMTPGPSLREALGDLLAFRAPPPRIRMLASADITSAAFHRVGASLREALNIRRDRAGE